MPNLVSGGLSSPLHAADAARQHALTPTSHHLVALKVPGSSLDDNVATLCLSPFGRKQDGPQIEARRTLLYLTSGRPKPHISPAHGMARTEPVASYL